MKRRKYRRILKQLQKRVFQAEVPAIDEAEPHVEVVAVIQWTDVVEILLKNLRTKEGE